MKQRVLSPYLSRPKRNFKVWELCFGSSRLNNTFLNCEFSEILTVQSWHKDVPDLQSNAYFSSGLVNFLKTFYFMVEELSTQTKRLIISSSLNSLTVIMKTNC